MTISEKALKQNGIEKFMEPGSESQTKENFVLAYNSIVQRNKPADASARLTSMLRSQLCQPSWDNS